jgi:hypothetical protein
VSEVAATVLGLSSASTSALIAASAVLGGILLGGLITAGTTAYFEGRRDRADARQARRLVVEELRTIWNQLNAILQRGQFPPQVPGAPPLLPTAEWEANRATLARHLPNDEWDALSPLMDSIPLTRSVVQRQPGSSLSEKDVAGLTAMRGVAAQLYTLISDGGQIDPIEQLRTHIDAAS